MLRRSATICFTATETNHVNALPKFLERKLVQSSLIGQHSLTVGRRLHFFNSRCTRKVLFDSQIFVPEN